jgi:hypothetical protein
MSTEAVVGALQADVSGEEVGKLLASHLHKPEKARLFQAALTKFLINKHFRFAATWSWWAFFGGPFYFFYRKIYTYGLMVLAIDFAATFFVPLAGLIVAICCGVCAKNFYCKKFIEDLEIAGYPNEPSEKVNSVLAVLGGCNTWAIIAFFILFVLKIAVLLFAGAIMMWVAGNMQ